MALQESSAAPEISLDTDAGEQFTLSALQGQNVVLYFYPKSDTPGCTTEACEFRDNLPDFSGLDAVIIGVSPDPVKAQAKFKTKHMLTFTILADVDHAAAEAYGVWVEKSMYGKKYMGVERSTFLIDKKGKIAKIFSKVKPAGHAAEVLAALKTI
jgi:thioredoxin-dependent peroxiredoxin